MLDTFKKIDLAFAKNFLIIAILSVYFSDGINKFFLIFFKYNLPLSKIIKLILLGGLVYGLIRQKQFFPIILFIMYAIGQYFITDCFSMNSLIIFSKYLFTASFLIYFTISKIPEPTSRRYIQVLELILLINSTLIIMGWIFDISFLRTYAGHRFGYNGLFLNSATGTYVYIIALFYYLIKYKKGFFLNPITWLMLFCCVLLGTKAALLGALIAISGYIFYFLKAKQRLIAIILGIFLSSGLFYYVFYFTKLFNSIRLSDGLLTAIFSFRNAHLQELTIPYISQYWGIINYLFGGVNDFLTRAQFGFLDEFYFFGIIGGVYYLFIQFRVVKNIVNIKLFKYLVIGLCIVILLAGNFFPYPSIIVYALGLIYIMKLEEHKLSIQ